MLSRLSLVLLLASINAGCQPKPAEEPNPSAASPENSDPASDSAPATSGGLGISQKSSDEARIVLEIMPTKVRVGNQSFEVSQEPRLRRIAEVQTHLPPIMGLPAAQGNRLVLSDYDISKNYLAKVDPNALGAEIHSAFQTAAFAGLPVFQIYPHSAVGYVRVPTPRGMEPGLNRLRFSETPLTIVVTSQAVELWRAAAQTKGEESSPEKRATIPLSNLQRGLSSALEEQCMEDARSCSPFFLNLKEDAKGSTLLAVLEAMESRPEFASATSPPARFFLVHGDVRKSPLTFRTIRMGATRVNGRLPAEVIRKNVREKFGEYRKCYQAGLENDPELTGKIVVRFVIGRDGLVSNAAYADTSSMPDKAVSECVVSSFKKLKFPKPEGGIVTVTYPITFAPE